MPRIRLTRDELVRRARVIRLLVLDVDGVLTDGQIIVDDNGVESKHFSVRDGAGIALWRRTGRSVAILSGRSAPVVARRAAELGIHPVVQGASDKGAAFSLIHKALDLEVHQVGFMGDDLPDLPVLLAGLGVSACPADAHHEVRERVDLVTDAAAGQGAVRELIEILLNAAGEWEPIVSGFLPTAGNAPRPAEPTAAPPPVVRTWTPTHEGET
jgi:3-deoxy-D-manno-octulosonate 8-phosphate phosphatase (KDO 8-P phosphatase)